MDSHDLLQLLWFAVPLALLAPALGRYIAAVLTGGPTLLSRTLPWVERAALKGVGAFPPREMTWRQYTAALLALHGVGLALTTALLMSQHLLPLNPEGLPGLSWDLALNTAVSFVTNTNWQAYSGETTLSHLSQMAALTTQNFVSAAVGLAVMATLGRAMSKQAGDGLGNLWQDLIRIVVYVLLPLSALLGLALVGQGVVQTLGGYVDLPGGGRLALGPAASQIAIKQLGTNGGGFFNANSAHPFENPTALSNLLQCVAILLIPAAQCLSWGHLVGDRRQGRALLAAMCLVFVPVLLFTLWAEAHGTPLLREATGAAHAVANLEGKELRFGVAWSALWATATTAASNGSVNAMHDSLTPLGGLGPLWLIQLGEVIFGGVGSGLYGMVVYVILAVFVTGLMVGRTPEYLGKKIEAAEVKMAALAVLIPSLMALIGTAAAVATEPGRAAILNAGPHGFTEVLYAFSSAANNNGSAFGGLSANSVFYNLGLGLCMAAGRLGVLLPVMAMAGALRGRGASPESAGTLPTHTPLFVLVLLGTLLLLGALTFLPALALGPVIEQLLMTTGA